MNINKLKEFVLILISIILVLFLFNYLKILKYMIMLFKVLIPLFIGFIYSWILNPFINKLSNKLNRNIVCIGLFLVIIALFGLFIYCFIPLFYGEMMEFVELLPNFFKKIEIKVEVLGLKELLDQIVYFFINNVPKYLISLVGNVFKYVGIIVVGLVLGLYISMDYEKIVFMFYSFFPKRYKSFFVELFNEISSSVRMCVNGTLLIAGFVFIMDIILFFCVGLDSAFLLGMICGMTDLIPYVGPYVGGVVAVLVAMSESRFLGILVLIICVVVQSVENYVLQPLIMSKSIKISPILIVITLLVFGKIFGVVGMIFATPFLAMSKIVVEYLYKYRKKLKKVLLDISV